MSKSSKSLATLPPQAESALRALGQRLRDHRLALNWTIGQTAERLLCSPTTYRALEMGKPSVSLGLLVNALWILGRLDDLGRVFPLSERLIATRRARRATGTRISDDERDF